MKKIILFIALFIGSFLSKAQVATASLQTAQKVFLDSIASREKRIANGFMAYAADGTANGLFRQPNGVSVFMHNGGENVFMESGSSVTEWIASSRDRLDSISRHNTWTYSGQQQSVFRTYNGKSVFQDNNSASVFKRSSDQTILADIVDDSNNKLQVIAGRLYSVGGNTAADLIETISNRILGTLSTSITALPTNSVNLATSALQTTGNTSLSGINTKAGNLLGNVSSTVLTFTVITGATPAALETAIGDFLALDFSVVIVSVGYSSTAYWNGSVAIKEYSALITYK